MKRCVRNEPVRVRLQAHQPAHFTWNGCDYEVITLLKMLGFQRPGDDVDTELWQVRAHPEGDDSPATFELRRDHADWQMAATWD